MIQSGLMALAPVNSPTLGELLKYVGDIRNEANDDETPAHRVLEMSETGSEPRSLPFVLLFNNLMYNVKVRSKMAVFGGRKRLGGAPATSVEPVGGENLFSRSKILLNDISGQARDGEILAVLSASGSGKSTLINALANRIAKGSLKGSDDDIISSTTTTSLDLFRRRLYPLYPTRSSSTAMDEGRSRRTKEEEDLHQQPWTRK